MKKIINSISCGQGAPSVFLIHLAGRGLFPCDVVIVADTGNENDMLWNTGQRTTAHEYFLKVTKPLAESYGIDAAFVRAVDKDGQEIPPIHEDQKYLGGKYVNGIFEHNSKIEIDMPLFGSDGGRLRQSCTAKWKKAAIRQELRRRGATHANVHLGLTADEPHRIKQSREKWEVLKWPLVFTRRENGSRGWGRQAIMDEMEAMGTPYIKRSQCDFCPHKNLQRWKDSSEETIMAAQEFEQSIGHGVFFLTATRVPLKEALAQMEKKQPSKSLFDLCDSGYCFT